MAGVYIPAEAVSVVMRYEWSLRCTHWQTLPSNTDSQIDPLYHHDQESHLQNPVITVQ